MTGRRVTEAAPNGIDVWVDGPAPFAARFEMGVSASCSEVGAHDMPSTAGRVAVGSGSARLGAAAWAGFAGVVGLPQAISGCR